MALLLAIELVQSALAFLAHGRFDLAVDFMDALEFCGGVTSALFEYLVWVANECKVTHNNDQVIDFVVCELLP